MKNNNDNHEITITILKGDGQQPTTKRDIIMPANVYTIPWMNLVKMLQTTFQVADKMNLNAIIPCGFNVENGPVKRLKENITKVSCIMLDIDGGGATIAKFKAMNRHREFFLYTTSSHGIKTGDRFRVILPLKEAITTDELYAKRETLFNYFNSPVKTLDDKSTFARGRIFFLPGCKEEQHKDKFCCLHNKGKLFDIKTVPYPREKVSQTYVNKFDVQDDDYVDYHDLTSEQQNIIDERAAGFVMNAISLSKNKGDSTSFNLACRLCSLGIPEYAALNYLTTFKTTGRKQFDPKHKVKSAYAKGCKGVNKKYLPQSTKSIAKEIMNVSLDFKAA